MKYKYFHDIFQETKKKLGLTQRELSIIFGCTETLIRNYETGRNSPNGYVISMMYSLCEDMDIPRPKFYDIPEDPFSLIERYRK